MGWSVSRLKVPVGGGPKSKLRGKAAGSMGVECARRAPVSCLFHATAQHLIGCNEHDADDEGDGEGADQALAHTCLADLLVGTGCSRPPGTPGEDRRGQQRDGVRSALRHMDLTWGKQGHKVGDKEAPCKPLVCPPARASEPTHEVPRQATHSPRPQDTPRWCPGGSPPLS